MNGTSGHLRVAMPAMDVSVTYAGSPVKPEHIELTDSCGQNWQPADRSRRDRAGERLARLARPALRDVLDLRRL